ncbi:glucans biosynthesis glucosyltransferase MdoH [Sphingomonas sp. ID0503]|uniref:glucans biosynthesis glucosyltransferase MdoH n=1 Tax=Sphingomonas sp. ID0503 TaxID=3399691 RepID=UPI003AFA986F
MTVEPQHADTAKKAAPFAVADLPPEAPIAMPEQALDRGPEHVRGVTTSPADILERRVLLILGTGLLAVAASTEMRVSLVGHGGMNLWEGALLVLFFPLFAWIAFGFLGSAIGFYQLMRQPRLLPSEVKSPPRPREPTAILVPVYNEDIEAVADRIEEMARSIDRLGLSDLFAFFVLSDSNAAAEATERAAVLARRGRTGTSIFYRRRPVNLARKPGNIADWVRRFGGAYPKMLVLDADSLMGGQTIAHMAGMLEASPGVGLIQTVPLIHSARTLFARWQQFANRCYGPMASAGLAWWVGSEATFWGHNAIIRTAAFAECCGLPELSGPPPFGGAIQSHDMFEAALLRRRGWAVHLVELPDSFEEYPPSLVDHAIRDRRWAQGNLQHMRVLDTAGVHWVNRLQLVIGASAFITSPLWLLLLLIGVGSQFTPDPLPVTPPGWILPLTVMLLFGPKIMATILTLSDARRCAGFGGARSVILSVLAEIPLSILMAPATMLTQTMDIIDILRGRPSGWHSQRRDVERLEMKEAVAMYRPHLILGTVFMLCTLAAPAGTWWTLPVSLGLLAAPLLASWTARTDLGERARAHGIFLVPTEVDVPPVLPTAAAQRAIA